MDREGWVDVNELMQKMNAAGRKVNFDLLKRCVDENDKKRFTFNEDFSKIRANQGHSIEVNLDLKAVQPPDILYHGTAKRFLPAILEKGLMKMQRQHVHLSADMETAGKVGRRHGKLVILIIDSKKMHLNGHTFFLSKNNVWLTDNVNPEFLSELTDI